MLRSKITNDENVIEPLLTRADARLAVLMQEAENIKQRANAEITEVKAQFLYKTKELEDKHQGLTSDAATALSDQGSKMQRLAEKFLEMETQHAEMITDGTKRCMHFESVEFDKDMPEGITLLGGVASNVSSDVIISSLLE